MISGQNQFLIGDGPKANWQGNIDEVMVWRPALRSDGVEVSSQNSLSPAFTPIPEPATGTLVGLGLAVFASRRRRLGATRP